MAIREIVWTVGQDLCSISPNTPQDGGVQGEHNVTKAAFVIPEGCALLEDKYQLYMTWVNGAGCYDKTEVLTIEEGRVEFLLPRQWTQYGGIGTISLVAEADGEVAYTLDGTVVFHSRKTALKQERKLIEGFMQEKCDAAAGAARDAKSAAEQAAQSANTAESHGRYADEAAVAAMEYAEQAERAAKKAAVFITPQEYGAKGDGVDDTEAFQAALDAAADAKATVLLPEGKYKLHSAVTVPIGVDIVGVNQSKCIVYTTGINLSQFNKISNFSIRTMEPPEGVETIDLINIHSDRMTTVNQEYLANITISDILFLGSHPSGAVKTPANMITLECRCRTLPNGTRYQGFYNVTIENVFADRFFKYGIYMKQHIEENKYGPWMTQIKLNNVFLGYPRWGIKGEVFVKDRDGNPFEFTEKQYKMGIACRGVSGQWSNGYSIGFIDIEYGNITLDGGCLIDTPRGEYHIVVRDETSIVDLQREAFNTSSTPPVRVAQRKTDRSVADPVTVPDPDTGEVVRAKPVLVKDTNGDDLSYWWHTYRTLSNLTPSAPNASVFHPGKFLEPDHLKNEVDGFGRAQYWPMYRCISFDEGDTYDEVFGFELLNSSARGLKRVKPGFIGFDSQRHPVYSYRNMDDSDEEKGEYNIHHFLTEEYMPHGSTEQRFENATEGVMYFDTTLGRPVWSKGDGEWWDGFGDVETALDSIIALQQSLIGGEGE